jgi:hypothetical protein
MPTPPATPAPPLLTCISHHEDHETTKKKAVLADNPADCRYRRIVSPGPGCLRRKNLSADAMPFKEPAFPFALFVSFVVW